MRFSRARRTAIAVTTVLFASLLTVAAPIAATAADAEAEAVPTAVPAVASIVPGAAAAPLVVRAPAPADAVTGGTVTGTVTTTAATEYLYVGLLEPDQSSGYYRWKLSDHVALADESGVFTLSGVPAGTYSAVFAAENETIAPLYYGSTYNITQAKSFKVTAGGTVTGINGTVVAGVTVSGKITDLAGKPVAGATAQVAQKITVDGQPFWEYQPVRTAADGSYSVVGFPPSTVAVRAVGPYGAGYLDAFYGGGTAFEKSKTFTLGSGQARTGVDIKLGKKLTVGTPSITGSAVVGSTLKAKAGTWTKGTRLTYQWYAAGRAISKATSSSFKVTSAQRSKNITVRVAGTLPTYASGYKVSKATLKVAAAATPKISGTAKVGKKLTAKPGTWTSGTKFTYQWYANGKAIKKATKSTFTITKSQKAKKITVKVTGKKSGHTTVSKVSKATKKVG